MSDRQAGIITEIEVEGIGMVRHPSMWQWVAIRRVRGPNRRIAQLAAACTMTIKQFKRLPIGKQQEVWAAYLTLTSPTNVGASTARANQPPAKFRKGLHRTDEEKVAIGRKLIAKKASLPRGHFGPWLIEQGIPGSFARMAMGLARAA